MTTMADLVNGTRVQHAGGDTGVIRVQRRRIVRLQRRRVVWHPDDLFGDLEVSPKGPVLPADLEILARNGRAS